MTTTTSTDYPITSAATGDPYIDLVHEYEMQIAQLMRLADECDMTPSGVAAMGRIWARIDDLDDFIGRLCD
jgi:hypothetical protein